MKNVMCKHRFTFSLPPSFLLISSTLSAKWNMSDDFRKTEGQKLNPSLFSEGSVSSSANLEYQIEQVGGLQLYMLVGFQ